MFVIRCACWILLAVCGQRAVEKLKAYVRAPSELSTPGDVLQRVAAAAGELLTDADPALLCRCESDACVLVFYDKSKAGHRRWCSTSGCGNRAKVNRFHARERAGGARRGRRRRR